ncbi:unnamed protein product, partial [Thlaspi arvense]
VISPAGKEGDVEVPANVSNMILHPPRRKRAPGRRKEKRIRSVTRVKKEKPNKYYKCSQPGHNRTSWPLLK